MAPQDLEIWLPALFGLNMASWCCCLPLSRAARGFEISSAEPASPRSDEARRLVHSAWHNDVGIFAR